MSTLQPEVTYRPLRADDRPEILSWAHDELFQSFIMEGAEAINVEAISARLSRDMDRTGDHWVIAADAHDKPLGAAWLLPSSRTQGKAFLNTYIVPNARRASLGRRLSAACIQRGFEHASFTNVTILVHGANTASVSALVDWANAAGATLESVYRDTKPYKGAHWNIHRFVINREQQALLRSIVSA